MITVQTQGGLGNQMFQHAMGLAQSVRLNTGLRIDRGANRLDSFRPFNLDLFQIPETVVENHAGRIVQEKNSRYESDIDSRVQDGDVLVGYWQSEKYFATVANSVLRRFRSLRLWTPEAVEFADLILSTGRNSIFLGVRRGDYVNKPAQAKFHGNLEIFYYGEALERVCKKLKSPVIFVFSDDVEWVRNNWHFSYPTYYWQNDATVPNHIGREDIDLGLMAMCNNAVIANSSFHWWGAWLGDRNRDGMVVAPKQWFLDPTAQANSVDIVPERWMRL